MCKFKAIYGNDWLGAFIKLVACLRKNEIHCVFIYDTSSPPDKNDEKADRAMKKELVIQKVKNIEESLEHYRRTSEVTPFLHSFYEKLLKENKNTKITSLLNKKIQPKIDEYLIEEALEKTRRQILNVTIDDFNLTKKLFDILKVPYFQAIMEAETFCSDLCKRGLVDAVLTEDTDVLAYSCPVFLSKIDIHRETVVCIKYEDVLNGLKLSPDQFLDLCIMIGCDYNTNIFKVGPEKSYKLLKEYSSIDGIKTNTDLDTTPLRFERCRQLFLDYDRSTIETIAYCGIPEFNDLQTFLKDQNVLLNVKELESSFIHNVIVFEENVENVEL